MSVCLLVLILQNTLALWCSNHYVNLELLEIILLVILCIIIWLDIPTWCWQHVCTTGVEITSGFAHHCISPIYTTELGLKDMLSLSTCWINEWINVWLKSKGISGSQELRSISLSEFSFLLSLLAGPPPPTSSMLYNRRASLVPDCYWAQKRNFTWGHILNWFLSLEYELFVLTSKEKTESLEWRVNGINRKA